MKLIIPIAMCLLAVLGAAQSKPLRLPTFPIRPIPFAQEQRFRDELREVGKALAPCAIKLLQNYLDQDSLDWQEVLRDGCIDMPQEETPSMESTQDIGEKIMKELEKELAVQQDTAATEEEDEKLAELERVNWGGVASDVLTSIGNNWGEKDEKLAKLERFNWGGVARDLLNNWGEKDEKLAKLQRINWGGVARDVARSFLDNNNNFGRK